MQLTRDLFAIAKFLFSYTAEKQTGKQTDRQTGIQTDGVENRNGRRVGNENTFDSCHACELSIDAACCSVCHKMKPSSSSFISRLSTRRKDSIHGGTINSLPSPMAGRRAVRPRPSISPGTLLGLGGGPASIVAAAGHDVSDLESVNDSDR